MPRNVFLLLCLIQTGFVALAQNVTFADFKKVGNYIIITYDIDKQADITITANINGKGKTLGKEYCEGDIGENISKGRNQVRWDILKDCDKEEIDADISFTISATQSSKEKKRQVRRQKFKNFLDIHTYELNVEYAMQLLNNQNTFQPLYGFSPAILWRLGNRRLWMGLGAGIIRLSNHDEVFPLFIKLESKFFGVSAGYAFIMHDGKFNNNIEGSNDGYYADIFVGYNGKTLGIGCFGSSIINVKNISKMGINVGLRLSYKF